MTANTTSDIKILENMAHAHVLVIGDMMLDRYVYGRVERISPESPVPILSVTRENQTLGGAGNTASNLAGLTCKTSVLSVLGLDENAAQILDMLSSENIETKGIIQTPRRNTIVKTRFLAGHQQLLRTDHEKIETLDSELSEKLIKLADAMIPECDVLILSDYGKGLLTRDIIQKLIATARHLKKPVFVDPKGRDYSIYNGATAVTPNKKELSEASGIEKLDTDADFINAARKLINLSGIENIIATRSQDGISVINAWEETHIRSAAHVEVYDVSGAGDTVIATLAASFAAGATLTHAAAIANAAGSIVVRKVGTAPIRAEELKDFLKNHNTQDDLKNNHTHWQSPILDWPHAKEEIQRWKARGLKVGFTNGCFDILHQGHVSYLHDARKKCDRLVVGVNSDASVKILKGPERPVHTETARAKVLAALGCVDMVIVFGAQNPNEDNTASALIKHIQPDLYFKGGDYTAQQIPEAPAIREAGGELCIMPVYKGHSTTSSIQTIKKSKT